MVRLNEPIGDDESDQWEREQALLVERQRKFLLETAAKLEDGRPLTDFELSWAVAAIRGAADNLSAPKRSKRHRTKKIPDQARVEFWMYQKLHGLSETGAVNSLAEDYSVDRKAMRKFLGLCDHNGVPAEVNWSKTREAETFFP